MAKLISLDNLKLYDTNIKSYINSVNNLLNYYTKTQTYTKEEVNDLIGNTTSISFRIVENLPDTGENNVIYLVPKTPSTRAATTTNTYNEYVWISSSNSFELIGTTDIDLSDYLKTADANGKFAVNITFSNGALNIVSGSGANLGTLYPILQASGNALSVSFTTNSATAKSINLKTINNTSLFGSGNFDIYDKSYIDTLVESLNSDISSKVSQDNLKTINGESLIGSGNIDTNKAIVNLGRISYTNINEVLNQVHTACYGESTDGKLVLFATDGVAIDSNNSLQSGYCLAIPCGDSLFTIWDGTNLYKGDDTGVNLVEIENDTTIVDLGTFTNLTGTLSSTILENVNNALSSGKYVIFKGTISGASLVSFSYFKNSNTELAINFYMNADSPDDTMGKVITLDLTTTTGAYTAFIKTSQGRLINQTNIRSINNQSLLGSGNINIDKIVNLGTLQNSGTLENDILQELLNNFQNFNQIQVIFVYGSRTYITANAYATTSKMGIVAYSVDTLLNTVDLSIDLATRNYTITNLGSQNSSVEYIDVGTVNNGDTIGTSIENQIHTAFNEGKLVILLGNTTVDNQQYSFRAVGSVETTFLEQPILVFYGVSFNVLLIGILLIAIVGNEFRVMFKSIQSDLGVLTAKSINVGDIKAGEVKKVNISDSFDCEIILGVKPNNDNIEVFFPKGDTNNTFLSNRSFTLVNLSDNDLTDIQLNYTVLHFELTD